MFRILAKFLFSLCLGIPLPYLLSPKCLLILFFSRGFLHVLIEQSSEMHLKHPMFAFLPFCCLCFNLWWTFCPMFIVCLPKLPLKSNKVSIMSGFAHGLACSSYSHSDFPKCAGVDADGPLLSLSCMLFCLSRSRCEDSIALISTFNVG